jgi:ornithine cyclodeaminase/alanine dehydrogenase-like protein (mu-crystallin family)
MLLIPKETVDEVLTIADTIKAVDDAFRRWGGSLVPERIQMRADNGELFIMAGELGTSGQLGLKTVTLFPGNDDHGVPRTLASTMAFDPQTGAVEVTLDATHITNYRTGAIGAVAARYLAPPDPNTVAIFGSSTQGRYQARALDEELNLEAIRIYSRSEMKHDAVEELSPELDARVVPADTPADACADAGVVVAATTSPVPVFDADDVEEGALIVGVGSNAPDMREIPGETMARAAGVYTDDHDLCMQTGDIADAVDEGHLSASGVTRFADRLTGPDPHRTDPEGTYVVKSVGSILLDIQVADTVIDRVRERGLGTTFDLQGLEDGTEGRKE